MDPSSSSEIDPRLGLPSCELGAAAASCLIRDSNIGDERMLFVRVSSSASSNCTIVCSRGIRVNKRRAELIHATYPDCNMLEGLIGTAKESYEIRVKTAVRLIPNSVERCIILSSCHFNTRVCQNFLPLLESINLPFEERFPRAAALLPCTSTLGEFVKGIKTSQMPISSS